MALSLALSLTLTLTSPTLSRASAMFSFTTDASTPTSALMPRCYGKQLPAVDTTLIEKLADCAPTLMTPAYGPN